MKENTSYKIVALLITLILWIIILGSKEALTVKMVPVEFILPHGMVIVNNVPNEVAFKIAGPRLILKKFTEAREPMIIDLSAAAEGVTKVRLHADSINSPPGIRILSMSPTDIIPRLEKTISKTVSIEANLKGKLRGNGKVKSINIIPNSMVLTGARSAIEILNKVYTAPIDLDKIENSETLEVPLSLNESGIDAPKAGTMVRVEIKLQ